MPNSIFVVTLSTQNNIKLVKQLESGFKRTINWNKYPPKATNQAQSFQGVNRIFVLSLKNDNGWESLKQYYLPTVEIKYYNVMIDGRNFFDQPIKSDLKKYGNIRKIATVQSDDYTTGCLLDYFILFYDIFKKYYKLITIDLTKQKKLDADPKAIQQINLIGNLDRLVQQCFSLLKKQKKQV